MTRCSGQSAGWRPERLRLLVVDILDVSIAVGHRRHSIGALKVHQQLAVAHLLQVLGILIDDHRGEAIDERVLLV